MARIRRVPEDVLRQLFERLNRSGELPILIAHLEDIGDGTYETIQAILAGDPLHEPRQLAECQAQQGALAALRNLVVIYKELGKRQSTAAQARAGSANGKTTSAAPRARV